MKDGCGLSDVTVHIQTMPSTIQNLVWVTISTNGCSITWFYHNLILAMCRQFLFLFIVFIALVHYVKWDLPPTSCNWHIQFDPNTSSILEGASQKTKKVSVHLVTGMSITRNVTVKKMCQLICVSNVSKMRCNQLFCACENGSAHCWKPLYWVPNSQQPPQICYRGSTHNTETTPHFTQQVDLACAQCLDIACLEIPIAGQGQLCLAKPTHLIQRTDLCSG